MKIEKLVPTIIELDWKPIRHLKHSAYVADTPGGFVELIDGAMTGFSAGAKGLWTVKNSFTESLQAELDVSTGRGAELDREVFKFFTGFDSVWESSE